MFTNILPVCRVGGAVVCLSFALPSGSFVAQTPDSYSDIASWRVGYFGKPDATGQAANDADPDEDGTINLLEYAQCTHPLQGDSPVAPGLQTSGDDLRFTYNCARSDVTYEVQVTSNLVDWTTDGVDQGTPDSSGEVTAVIEGGAAGGKFARLRIVFEGQEYFVPLFTEATEQEPALQVDATDALYTYLADRGRDRHAREDQFQNYEHYLSFYWEDRTVEIEIVDTIPKGGNTITFNVRSPWKFKDSQAELRFFYRGIGTVAEYWDNRSMTEVNYNPVNGPFFKHYPDDLSPVDPDTRYYTRSVNYNVKEGREIEVGDRMEFELSQFLDDPPNGRENYYGTTFLYVVGEGLVPWYTVGEWGNPATELEDSYAVAEKAWLGGDTTLHYNYSDEPDNEFMQMATNLAPVNAQRFVLGRRVHHTDVGDGSHDEPVSNPIFGDMVGLLGKRYVNRSCVACHDRNGRAVPPAAGTALDTYVFKIGDASGNPHPTAGVVLQPKTVGGATLEGEVTLSEWQDVNGLRKPVYSFTGISPARYSARIAPQLVGLGLLEAIPEEAIMALADPDDEDEDGISGKVNFVDDPETGDLRIGRFGWKAGQHSIRSQVAAAFNTDMGVMTSVFPHPDSGDSVPADEDTGSELADEHLEQLTAYVSLLGIRPQRDYDDALVVKGEQIFTQINCAACHTPSFTTSGFAPHAELRNQLIRPYTDLLLHDMGPGLADNLGEGSAAGSEWRTPPLWGIGLTAGVSKGEGYLHDGRARTLEEAILWHGGEGAASRQAYEALDQADKNALIAFLESL